MIADTDTEAAELLAAVVARYAQPDPACLAKLPKPTKKDNPKGKCDVCGGWHGLPAVHLDYMGHADVTLALIDVDPLWTWEPAGLIDGCPVVQNQSGRLVLWGYVTVLGVRRLGVGTCAASQPDPEKELIGDLLRNVAMRFGIATRLWSKADSADPAGSGVGGGYGHAEKPQRPPQKPRGTAREIGEGPPVAPDIAKQRTLLMLSFGNAGMRNSDAQHAFLSNLFGRDVVSSNDLTPEERSRAIEALKAVSA